MVRPGPRAPSSRLRRQGLCEAQPCRPAVAAAARGPVGLPGRRAPRASSPQVVIRRLPPGLTKEQLEAQLQPLPAHDYFEFFTADLR